MMNFPVSETDINNTRSAAQEENLFYLDGRNVWKKLEQLLTTKNLIPHFLGIYSIPPPRLYFLGFGLDHAIRI